MIKVRPETGVPHLPQPCFPCLLSALHPLTTHHTHNTTAQVVSGKDAPLCNFFLFDGDSYNGTVENLAGRAPTSENAVQEVAMEL